MINRIFNEDCINGMQWMADSSVDLIVTDPPYLIDYRTNRRKNKEHPFCTSIKNDDNPELVKKYLKECYRVLKNDSALYVFCSCDTVDFFKIEIEKYFTIKNIIIWVKNNHTAGDLQAQFGKKYEMIILANKGRKRFNGKRLTDVWFFDRVAGKKQLHQNQKPIELIERCILKHSNENDLVFDGFMGSGTTALAAMETGRNFIGFEIDKTFFDIAQRRIYESLESGIAGEMKYKGE